MTETTNLHLTKDADTDYYSVSRVNANSDKIDTFAGEVSTALGGKVDKVNGKGLSENDYTDSEKTKLAGLENYDDTALSERVTALETALTQTEWNEPDIHSHNTGQLDVQTGGWIKVGKIAIVSIRFRVKKNEETGDDYKININTAVFANLPKAVSSLGGTGNSCVAVANTIGGYFSITDAGTMIYLANNSAAIPQDTLVSVSAAYLCQ